MDFCVLLGAALFAGQWAWAWPSGAPVLCATALCMVALRHELRSWWRLAALAGAFAIGGWRARNQVATFDQVRALLQHRLSRPERCEGRARVHSSPMQVTVATSLDAGSPASEISWNGVVSTMRCADRELVGPVTVRFYGGPPDLARGDVIAFDADLGLIELLRNAGLDDPRPRAAARGAILSGRVQTIDRELLGTGPTASIDRERARVRARIEATFAPGAAPLARALVLGETDLDPEDVSAFRTSGLAHLLAVSGTHLILAVVTAVRALRAILVRIEPIAARCDAGRVSAALGVALAWAYADFAGGSGSARRAAAMLSVAFLARAFGRAPVAARSYGLSLLGGAVVDPLAAFDASFVLSAAATAGMLLLQRPFATALAIPRAQGVSTDLQRCRPLSSWMRKQADFLTAGVATTLAATLACAPYLVLLAPSLPLGGLFANVLAAPIGELVALPLCLAHAVLRPWPWLEQGAAVVASGSLLLVRAVAHATTSLRWLSPSVPSPTGWQLAVVAAFTVWLWRWPGPAYRRVAVVLVAIASLCAFEVAAARNGAPRGGLRITYLDVGQGDSALIDLPSGGAMLIDGGGALGAGLDPGRVVLAPLLRSRRRSRIDVVVLSHPHPDHLGGLLSGLSDVTVGEFWDNGQGASEGAGATYDALIAAMRSRGVPVRVPQELCGRAHTVGGATVRVLAPCPQAVALADPNDNSFVLRVEFGRRAAMFVGDAPIAVENELLASYAQQALMADVLKVGHHGSKTSTSSAWLEAVHPEFAVLSVGARNRFGHPSPATLDRLAEAGAISARTDRDGSFCWETDGDDVWFSSYGSGHGRQ